MTNDQFWQDFRYSPMIPSIGRWFHASLHSLDWYGFPMNHLCRAKRMIFAGFDDPTSTGGDDTASTASAEMAYAETDWSFDRSVDSYEDLGVGVTVSFTKRIDDEDVSGFAHVSGDTNRLHLDEEFATSTRFGDRIVHGTLLSGLISAALAYLPGLTIYLSQDLDFLKPVEIGATVTATCTIVEDLGGRKYRLTTIVSTDDGDTVIDGEAVVLIDELPES